MCLLGSFSSRAGMISMEATAEAVVSNGFLEISCRVHNHGDADAEHAVLSALRPAGESKTLLGSVPAGATRRGRLSMPLPAEIEAGEHHAILTLTYRDRGGGTAGMPLAVPFRVEAPSPPLSAPETPTRRLTARLAPLRLRRRGKLVLTAAALHAPSGIEATVTLALPPGIGHDPGPHLWTVPAAGGSRTFAVTNLAASAGNRYPVLAVLDYRERDQQASIATQAMLEIVPSGLDRVPWRPLLLSAALAILLFGLFESRRRYKDAETGAAPREERGERWVSRAATAAAVLGVAWQVAPPEILWNTTAVGGDTVAHHYLVTQLRRNLLESGRILGWAPGWWGGFPLFQFYFPLPYLFILGLDLLLSYNLAFKLGSVLALALTPALLRLAGTTLRLPRPLPAYLALASVPVLLDTTHTMWGVNAYSTLAGMIANSYSFALLPLALATAARDARCGRVHLITVLAISAVMLSHFFTSLLLVLVCASLPWLPGIANRRRAFRVLLAEGVTSVLLCAWWLVPLIAKRDWAIDFGVNWEVDPLRNLPVFLRWAAPPLIGGALLAEFRRPKPGPDVTDPEPSAIRTFTGMLTVLLGFALGLFYVGFRLSPVFVNIRLWPFIVFSLAMLTAVCAARIAARRRLEPWGLIVFALGVFALGWDRPNNARAWARHNFRGLEARAEASEVFSRLVEPLDGTPGRLAYDLHPDNERLGSSRVFECVPHLIDKPILEGGLVNSALGALPAYLIQSETSDNAAGFPPILEPRRFDIQAATLHMNWMNVAHFIARSPRTQAALREHPSWREIARSGPWSLFHNLSQDGRRVKVARNAPQVVLGSHPKEDILEWLYCPSAADIPYILIPEKDRPSELSAPAIPRRVFLERMRRPGRGPLPAPGTLFSSDPVRERVVTPHRIAFTTSAIGKPHIVSEIGFPNWTVRGASGPYLVAPGVMLVIPHEPDVELCYTRLPSDHIGRGLSLFGIVLCAGYGVRRLQRRRFILKYPPT